MKKYLLTALLFLGIAGTSFNVIAQDGPKEDKKEQKVNKKLVKAKKKDWNGSERKENKKKEKAYKKANKADIKDEKMK